jgi:gliding motility-associated-like protein
MFKYLFGLISLLLMLQSTTFAEGSKDFTQFPGYRLFLWAEQAQQFKVYAKQGEYINVGSSHVGIAGGFIKVYRPDGTLHATFDNTGANVGKAIINDDIEERNGPTGGGIRLGPGYIPGTVPVLAGQNGIWTVTFEYPTYQGSSFINIMNGASWTRIANQPTNQRVVLAWDITVTQGTPGNAFGLPVEGRVFSNEYHSIVSRNGNPTSAEFFVLNKKGFVHKIKFNNTDPWGFPLFSNNVGITDHLGTPLYQSFFESSITRTFDFQFWQPGKFYLYEPQAEDLGDKIVNNKIFFNTPDPNMPLTAKTTDVFRNNTHTTWLYFPTPITHVNFLGFNVVAYNPLGLPCLNNALQPGIGGYFKFSTDQEGTGRLRLDLNNNGIFTDSIDRTILEPLEIGVDSIFWDGLDGFGNEMPIGPDQVIGYQLTMLSGEIHIMMSDIENDLGGVTVELVNNPALVNSDAFTYNHESIGGPKSGDPASPLPLPTNTPFTYNNNFGDEKLLDMWTQVEFTGALQSDIMITVLKDCTNPIPIVDSDNDGIEDRFDLDDDNDGIPDKREYCQLVAGFSCLNFAFDPSGDEDFDGILNFEDADDPAFNHGCLDTDMNGRCDQIPAVFDTDGDNIPNHLDLDSDNDGISDLFESGHTGFDLNGDGILDGNPSDFGLNGFFNPLATNPDGPDAMENYLLSDTDSDGVLNFLDLDADNDGIHDITEGSNGNLDVNNDGRADVSFGFASNGFSNAIDPNQNTPLVLPVDTDSDGVRDYLDRDSDNDGINDVAEASLPDPDNDGEIGNGTPVVDANGLALSDMDGALPPTTSVPTNSDNQGSPDYISLDSDNDGIPDVLEAFLPDSDLDGILGQGIPMVNAFGQPNADSNGNPLVVTSNPRDLDGDGIPDFQDPDRDNDGINDNYECETGFPCPDSDNDGTPDIDDLDSDNDGLSDEDECQNGAPCPDSDNNGVDNFRQFDCIGVNVPEITSVGQGGTFCEGESYTFTLTAGMVSGDTVYVHWASPSGALISDTVVFPDPIEYEIVNLSPLDSGMWTVVLETTLGCYSFPQDVMLDVHSEITKPVVTTNKSEVCDGESFTLSTDGVNGSNVQYQWFINQGPGNVFFTSTSNPFLTQTVNSMAYAGDYSVKIVSATCESEMSDPVSVMVSDVPEVISISNISSQTNPVCSGNDIQISLDVDSGMSFSWTGPNGFTSNVQNPVILNAGPNDAGTYSVVVSNNNCSSAPESTEVFVNPSPATPDINANDTEICGSENLNLSTTAVTGTVVNYDWYLESGGNPPFIIGTSNVPSISIPDMTNRTSGFYSVVVTVDGCISSPSSSIEIQINSVVLNNNPQNTTAANDPACEGVNVQLSTDTIAGATYSWTGPNGFTSNDPNPVLANVTMAEAGMYEVNISLNGCNAPAASTEVFISDKPSDPLIGADNTSICKSLDLTLNTSSYNGQNVIYDWYLEEPGGSPVLIGSTNVPSITLPDTPDRVSGNYTVMVTVDGCISNASNPIAITIANDLTINDPTTNSSLANPICEGETIKLFADNIAGATFDWLGPNGFSSNDMNPVISNATTMDAGIYQVVVSKDGCVSNPANVEVFVREKPEQPVIRASDTEVCEGDNVNLSTDQVAGSNVQYRWYHNFGGQLFLLTTTGNPNYLINDPDAGQSGNYFVQIVVDGCESDMSDPIFIDINRTPPITGYGNTTSALNPACEGDAVVFSVNAIPNATYTWTGPNGFMSNDQNPVLDPVTVQMAGTYQLSVSADGCFVPAGPTQVFVNPSPETPVLVVNKTSLCADEALTLTAQGLTGTGYTYHWYIFRNGLATNFESGSNPELIISNTTPLQSGIYYVIVELNGCFSEPSNQEQVIIRANPVLDVPGTNATVNNQLCEGETLELNINPIAGATYTWFGPNNFSSNLSNPEIPNAGIGTSGYYWVQVNVNGCSSISDSVEVFVRSKPEAASLENPGTFCEGSAVDLTISNYNLPSGAFFEILDENNNVIGQSTDLNFALGTVNISDGGRYFVRVVDNGCVSDLSQGVRLQVDTIPSEVAVIVPDEDRFCNTEEIEITAIAPIVGTGLWTTDDSGVILNPGNNVTSVVQVPTGYSAYIWTLSNGVCRNYSADTLTIEVIEASVDAVDDYFELNPGDRLDSDQVLANDAVDLNEPWNLSILEFPILGSINQNPDGSFTYRSSLDDYNPDSFQYEICHDLCAEVCDNAMVYIRSLGIEEPDECFYPNYFTPNSDGANDAFEIKCLDSGEYPENELIVFNRWGDVVYQAKPYRNDWAGTYRNGPLPPGTYFYCIKMRPEEEAVTGFITLLR